jgi:hypothetical protein
MYTLHQLAVDAKGVPFRPASILIRHVSSLDEFYLSVSDISTAENLESEFLVCPERHEA